MKRIATLLLSTLLSTLLLGGCLGANRAPQRELVSVYKPRYAERFEVLREADGSAYVLRVRNPWQGADSVLMEYRIERAAQRVVCMSSTHVAFLDALGRANAIKGVSGRGFIHTPLDSSVREVGYDQTLDYEALVTLRPDAVLAYGVWADDMGAGKMRQLGLPVIYIADYLEQDPLGRAEWIVALGMLVGRLDQAAELFLQIEERYRVLAEQVAGYLIIRPGAPPRVMLNDPYRDVWWMPGDRNYLVQLLRDAGADYLGSGHDTQASRPMSSEQAYMLLSQADYWLNPGSARSLSEVKANNRPFAALPVVRRGRVYNNNARTTPGGGSDFWESGAVRPDIVLQDLIRILHPELTPRLLEPGELYYFQRLE